MTIRCSVLGHMAGPTHFHNQGLDFAICHHCGSDLVRSEGKDWAEVPQGFRVVWRESGREGDAASVAERMQHLAPQAPPRRALRNARPAPRRDPRGRPFKAAASVVGLFAGLGKLIEGETPDTAEIDAKASYVILLPSAGAK